MSAGVYGWPIASAADIAIATVRETNTNVTEARFVLFSDDAEREFTRALNS